MKQIFYEATLIFGLNPLILDSFSKNGKNRTFMSKIGQNGPDWSNNVQNRVFSAHFGFSGATRVFVGSVTCRFQENSVPVILSSFFSHFIVRYVVSTYGAEGCKILQTEPIS